MKSRMFVMLSSLALLTAGATLAQSTRTMQVNIPFEFHAGEKSMPAGHYDVRVDVTNGVVTIQNGHAAVMSMSSAITNKATETTGKLVFKRYGKNYFLSTVTGCQHGLARQLKSPKAGSEWALNGAPDAIVEVALATK